MGKNRNARTGTASQTNLKTDSISQYLKEVQRRLSSDQEAHVDAHLKECRSCRLSVRMTALISGRQPALKAQVSERHFSPQLLGRYYSTPTSLDPSLVTQIETHLGTCIECAADLAFLKNSDMDLRQVVLAHRKQSFAGVIRDFIRSFFRK